MSINNLEIKLDAREDANGQVYYLGRQKAPYKIDLTNGATFLIFVSEPDEEELQIACNNKENTTFSKYSRRADRFKISLEDREDQFGQTFYVAKLQYNGYIDCSVGEGVVFIVFTSKEDSEELQIVGEIVTYDQDNLKSKKADIEVIRKSVRDES